MSRLYAPRPYQRQITQHVQSLKRCMVFAGMGTGKTVSVLTALAEIDLVEPVFPALVIAPARVAAATWPDEVAKWEHLSHLKIVALNGAPKERAEALLSPADVFTVSFELLPWLARVYGADWPFRTVVVDEVTKMKGLRVFERKLKDGSLKLMSGGGTKRAKALAMIAHTKIDRIIGLTGTPAPNGLQDLWGPLWLVDRGSRLGRSFSAFEGRWFHKWGQYDRPAPNANAPVEIQDRIRDVCLTIRAEDWFDLKAPIVRNIEIELPPPARQLYRGMERDMFAWLSDGEASEAAHAAAASIKCLQIANGLLYLDQDENDTSPKEWREVHDLKIQALDEIIEEANGAPVLVAYHFRADLERLLKAFPQGRVLDKAPATIKAWNEGRIPVLFAHPAACGHGLNLQDGGNILVYFSHWWNLEERQQIAERIGPVRQLQAGHNRNVFHYNIIARNTVDEDVIERVESKRDIQNVLLDALRRRGHAK